MENRKINGFEDLIVWQKAHKLMLGVYKLTALLPLDEKYNRITQLKRAASSVSANIAEGFGRYHFQENIQFCRQARGSLEEVKNHIIAARDLLQAPEDRCAALLADCDEVKLMLNSYTKATRGFKDAT